MPEVSIIVPVYNVEPYLPRCIDSILSQTYSDFELLLIDDGSSDNSGRICDDYAGKDDRIRVFHKENGGVSSARNTGLLHASGSYIGFVDSDDAIESTLLSHIFSSEPTEDAVFFHYTEVQNGQKTRIYQKGLSELAGQPQKYMRLYQPRIGTRIDGVFLDESISVFCVRAFYKRSYLQSHQIRFDTGITTGEDRIFLLTLLNSNPTIRTVDDEFGYYYYIRGSSLTGAKSSNRYCDGLYEKLRYFYEVETSLCSQNPALSEEDINRIQLQRCEKMRLRVILNDFKYNPKGAVAHFSSIRNDPFFKKAFSHEAFMDMVTQKRRTEAAKIAIIRLRCYHILLFAYSVRKIASR